MEIKNKYVRAIDFVIIAGTLIGLLGLVGYARPLVIGPSDNYETSNNSVLFSFDKGEVILIDDNKEFSSPEKIYAEDYLVVNLKPGKYYWKIDGALPSSTRELTIKSVVDLKLKRYGEGYQVSNGGNTQLDVEIYENQILNNTITLDVDESEKVSGTAFVGREND